jgi:hypothetical protein
MKKMKKLSGVSFQPSAKTYMGAVGQHSGRAPSAMIPSFFNMAEWAVPVCILHCDPNRVMKRQGARPGENRPNPL